MTEAAFHSIWIPLQERFYRVAYYILEDRADALDTVQDLYVKLWRIRDSLDLVRNPGAYGSLLVKNLCIDRIRKERKAEPLCAEAIEAFAAVAVVCGADSTTADRYEARNDALRSIA